MKLTATYVTKKVYTRTKIAKKTKVTAIPRRGDGILAPIIGMTTNTKMIDSMIALSTSSPIPSTVLPR